MPNTTLPTNRGPGSPGIISDSNIVHAEINRLSRDTGWRNVTSLIRNGASATSARIRRQDNLVIFEVHNLSVAGVSGVADGVPVQLLLAGEEGASDISSNFLPGYPLRGPVMKSLASGLEMQLHVEVLSGGAQYISATFYQGRSTGNPRIQLTYYCDKPWPTFLP
ncbi:MAG: hypothetical protein ACTH31_00855 [Pseudoclavibacter sp.]